MDQSWMRSELTDWERELLTMGTSDIPVRDVTADENASQE